MSKASTDPTELEAANSKKLEASDGSLVHLWS